MRQMTVIAIVLILGVGNWGGVAISHAEKPFAPNVDQNTGAISVPED